MIFSFFILCVVLLTKLGGIIVQLLFESPIEFLPLNFALFKWIEEVFLADYVYFSCLTDTLDWGLVVSEISTYIIIAQNAVLSNVFDLHSLWLTVRVLNEHMVVNMLTPGWILESLNSWRDLFATFSFDSLLITILVIFVSWHSFTFIVFTAGPN
jgi:hypothetical protein